MLLETKALSKSFGGLKAVDSVDFKLLQGGLHALIGPNGAGKTTFVNLLSGRIRPTEGRIFFAGEDITALPTHVISRKGIAYTFQLTSVFPRITVFDNVRLAVQSKVLKRASPLRSQWIPEVTERVEEILALLGLENEAETLASNLSHGDQRRLEIGIALGLEPRLLLLDEPTGGMSLKEVLETVELVESLAKHKTILLIEHNIDVVMRVAQTVSVMDRGRIIAEGPPEMISRDENVQEIYLGRAEA